MPRHSARLRILVPRDARRLANALATGKAVNFRTNAAATIAYQTRIRTLPARQVAPRGASRVGHRSIVVRDTVPMAFPMAFVRTATCRAISSVFLAKTELSVAQGTVTAALRRAGSKSQRPARNARRVGAFIASGRDARRSVC
jgi:hypothetical protein